MGNELPVRLAFCPVCCKAVVADTLISQHVRECVRSKIPFQTPAQRAITSKRAARCLMGSIRLN
jgi:hypothetical protein